MKVKSKKASALIITLWLLSFFTIFAVGLAHNAFTHLRLASYLSARLKMYYLALAGIERGIIELRVDKTPDYDSLNENWSNNEKIFKQFSLDGGNVTLSYQLALPPEDKSAKKKATVTLYGVQDESSKIDINRASVDVLKTMLENIGGIKQDKAADIANSIVDWRDIDVVVSPGGAENSYYENLDLPYPCKNGSFQIPEELLLVKGMTPEIFSRIAGVITLYGNGRVNINTVD